jgi:hypothetical protein
VGRRAGLDVSGKEKMLGLELRTIRPIVDYIPYDSEEGAACICGEEDGGRTDISGFGEFKPNCMKLTAVPSTPLKLMKRALKYLWSRSPWWAVGTNRVAAAATSWCVTANSRRSRVWADVEGTPVGWGKGK